LTSPRNQPNYHPAGDTPLSQFPHKSRRHLILDLEDSIASSAKLAARSAAAARLASDTGRPGIIVRINSRDTEWYLPPLVALVPRQPEAILLPKCTGPGDLQALDHHLEALEVAMGVPVGSIGVLALATETAASLRCMDTPVSRRGSSPCCSAPRTWPLISASGHVMRTGC